MSGTEVLAWQLVGILSAAFILLLWDDILNRRCMDKQAAALRELDEAMRKPKMKSSKADQLRVLRACANGTLARTIGPEHPDFDVVGELIDGGFMTADIAPAEKVIH